MFDSRRYNPRVVEERRQKADLASDMAAYLVQQGATSEPHARSVVAPAFFLRVDEVPWAPLSLDALGPEAQRERRKDPLLASDVIDALQVHLSPPREVAYRWAAEVFFMDVEKLASFYRWLNDEEPGDLELTIPLTEEEAHALRREHDA